MPATDIISDPTLVSVLAAAEEARNQCLAMLDLLERQKGAQGQAEEENDDDNISSTLPAHLALLRGLNRKAILRVRQTKSETSAARQEIDNLHLELGNLYYEQRHLRGEIAACEGYEHRYLTLPLVEEETFREEVMGGGDEEGEEDGDVMVKRIEDEGRRRRELEAVRQGLERRKNEVAAVTKGKKEELGKLDAEVEKWVLQGKDGVGKILEAREKKVREEREKEQENEKANGEDDDDVVVD